MKMFVAKSLLFFLNNALFAQGDCPSLPICTNQNSTLGIGIINELNPGNRGCLLSNEATASIWYSICTLTGGTIQFTISPSGNNNDYDFAVWTGLTCPPAAAPIRCSYALSQPGPGGDNTGVNSANNAPQTDNSEGVFGNQWVQDIIAAPGQCFTICINNYGPGSNNFTLTFGGTATLNCGFLPIELKEFFCDSYKFGIVLSWITLTEINHDRFEVERSIDGINFISVFSVQGNGNSYWEKLYLWTDKDPSLGQNYYRLKQVDNDEQETYYKTIVCLFDRENDIYEEVYNIHGQRVSNDTKGLVFLKTVYKNQVIWQKMIR